MADIDRRTDQQSIVSTIRDYTLDLGIQIIAEGIETPEELQVLQQMGIDMGHGFFWTALRIFLFLAPWRFRDFHALPPWSLPSQIPWRVGIRRWSMTRLSPPIWSLEAEAWNAAAAEFTGWSQEIMEQSRCFDGHLAHESAAGQPLCLGACAPVWAMVHRSGSRDTVTLKTASGERGHATIVSMPIYDPVRQRVWGAVEYFWESSSGQPPLDSNSG